MNCFRFANVMNNAMVINTFNSANKITAFINTQNRQVMETITYRILKFEPMIKKSIVANYTFFTVMTLSNINSFA